MQKIQLNFFFTLCIALVCSSQKLFSQQILKEVTLVYDISLTTSKSTDPVKPFQGVTLSLYVKGNHSRTDMSTIIGKESNIYNNGSKAGFILKEYSGQKLIITLNESNWLSRNEFFSAIDFEILDDEELINGFRCKKAKALNNKSFVSDIYFTKDFVIANNNYYNCFSKLPGIPVKYSIKKEDKVFVYNLKSLSFDNIASLIFEEPQGGYRKITYEEALKVNGE